MSEQTLEEFLLARVAEDEAAVRRNWNEQTGMTDERWWGTPFQPSRVLVECQAKRRIIERHTRGGGIEPWTDEVWIAGMETDEIYGYCEWCTYDDRTVAYPCPDLCALALPYADHPDCDKAWLPLTTDPEEIR